MITIYSKFTTPNTPGWNIKSKLQSIFGKIRLVVSERATVRLKLKFVGYRVTGFWVSEKRKYMTVLPESVTRNPMLKFVG